MGTARPDVVLFVEKATTARVASRVCEEPGDRGRDVAHRGHGWLAEMLRAAVLEALGL